MALVGGGLWAQDTTLTFASCSLASMVLRKPKGRRRCNGACQLSGCGGTGLRSGMAAETSDDGRGPRDLGRCARTLIEVAADRAEGPFQWIRCCRCDFHFACISRPLAWRICSAHEREQHATEEHAVEKYSCADQSVAEWGQTQWPLRRSLKEFAPDTNAR